VITTAGTGKSLSGATDLDVSIQSGKFVKHLAEAQPAEIDLFKSAFTSYELPMPLTGTCVLITKVDNIGRITEYGHCRAG
jgi:hypothetical protein